MSIMESSEPKKFDISLKEISVLVEAKNYWESPTIRKKIRRCISDDDFNDVLLHVLRMVKDACIPESLKRLIRDIIPFIGKKIFHWIRYVTSDLKLGLQYTENMYWTNYGTIDEAKTFQVYWKNDKNLLREYSNGLPSLYSIACINCQEQFVSDNLDHMRVILQKYCGSLLNIPENVSAHSLMSIWICCYAKKSKDQGCELYKTATQSKDPEAKLFEVCVSEGFLNGVKYFGNQLKSGKDRLFYLHAIFTLKEVSLSDGRDSKRDKSDRRNNFIEIIIFLIKEMIPETQSLYLCQHLKHLFVILIQVWPHNKSFLFEILNCSLPDLQDSDKENLLTSVFSHLGMNDNQTTCKVANDFTKRIIREILVIILKQTPVQLKNKMIIEKAGDFFKKLIYEADFLTIEVIFNDPYIKTHRHDIVISKIVEAFRRTCTERDIDFLQKFTEEYLTGDEKEEFKTNFKNFGEVLAMGRLDLCKKLIRWIAQSQEEMRNLKNEINAKDIFLNAVSGKNVESFLSIAEELLNWQFDYDTEQIRAFKEKMRSEVPMTDDFIRTNFYEIWNGNLLPAPHKRDPSVPLYICSQFLFFIFERNEAKIFIKEKMFGCKSFIGSLTPEKLKTLNDLLRYCGLTATEVVQLKQEILEDSDSLISYFAIERFEFVMANHFLNWLVADEEKKKKVVGNFLDSENGVLLCCKMLGPSVKYHLDSARLFLNLWVKQYKNTSELLSRMTELLDTAELSKIKRLFRKIEENECLTRDDLIGAIRYK